MTVQGDGGLQVRRCAGCGNVQQGWKHRYCDQCWSSDLALETASGRALLKSWVVYHHDYHLEGFTVPYAVGWAELEEGPGVACHLVGDLTQARPDQPIEIRVAERPLDGADNAGNSHSEPRNSRLAGIVYRGSRHKSTTEHSA